MSELIENQDIARAAGTAALPVVQQIGPSDPGQLIQLAIQKDFDVERLREVMTLEREWRADKAKAEYSAAMVKFGSMKKTIQHNKTGKTAGGASFSYSDFPAIAKAVTPLMTDCGLSFSHRFDPPVMTEAGKVAYITVYCRVTHALGHFEEIHFPAMPDMRLDGKVSPSQLIQLAITYAKRQTLCMALGLSTAEDATDDDSVRHYSQRITKEQVANLVALGEEVKANMAQFLKFLKVDSLDDLPASEYEKAVKALEGKRKQ